MNSAQRIAGGYVLVSTAELCLAWTLYRAKRIRLIDLRTWFACKEMATRRRFSKTQKARFSHEELHRLIGGVGGEHIRSSLRRLEAAKLVQWGEGEIQFAKSASDFDQDVRELFTDMMEKIVTSKRLVPLPRRQLRLLAGGCRRTVIATLLAHLIRCLFIRKGKVSARGFCKASWVADVFGISERNVKEARRHLVELQVLVAIDVPQWRLNRLGKCLSVNLAWSRNGEGRGEAESGSSPLPAPSTTGSAPLESNKKLLPDLKNQKPAAGSPSGVFGKQDRKSPKPALSNILREDLASTGRLLELHREAVGRRLVSNGEHGRLQFVAAAEHARTIGSRNPPGLFAAILKRKLWHVVTQADEDAAVRRLKSFDLNAEKRNGAFRAARSETPHEVAELLKDLVARVGQMAAAKSSGDR